MEQGEQQPSYILVWELGTQDTNCWEQLPAKEKLLLPLSSLTGRLTHPTCLDAGFGATGKLSQKPVPGPVRVRGRTRQATQLSWWQGLRWCH